MPDEQCPKKILTQQPEGRSESGRSRKSKIGGKRTATRSRNINEKDAYSIILGEEK